MKENIKMCINDIQVFILFFFFTKTNTNIYVD